jgi:hypothetical protein
MGTTFATSIGLIPSHLRGAFRGRGVTIQLADWIFIPADAGIGEGGSIERFELVRQHDGLASGLKMEQEAYWSAARAEGRFAIPAGFLVRVTSRFRGGPERLRFVLPAGDFARALPHAWEALPAARG